MLVPFQPAGRKKGGAIPNASDILDNLQKVDSKGSGVVNVCQILQEENIWELAQHIAQDNLSKAEVKAISKVLTDTASNTSTGLSRLSKL